MKLGMAIVLAALLVAITAPGEVKTTSTSGAGAYAMTLSIAPTASGAYECTAEIKDLQSNQLLSAPHVTFQANQKARTVTTTGEFQVGLDVFVDSSRKIGQAEMTVRKGSSIVSAQSIHLQVK